MPDIITSQERSAIAAFISQNGINKVRPGSSVPYGEEVMTKGRRRYVDEKTKAFRERDDKVRALAAKGMTRKEIAEELGVKRSIVDWTVGKLCLDVVSGIKSKG